MIITHTHNFTIGMNFEDTGYLQILLHLRSLFRGSFHYEAADLKVHSSYV